jgi:hypothetical protein
VSDERSRDRWWIDVAIVAPLLALPFAPLLVDRRRPGTEARAIGALKTFNTSQTLFREGDKEGDGTLDYATLDELSNASLVDGVLGSGVKEGYRFEVRASPTTSEFLWFAVANPVDPGVTGDRFFCTNEGGIIYYTTMFGGGPILLQDGGDACAIPATLLPVGK